MMMDAKANASSGYLKGMIEPSLLTMLQAEATKMEKTNFEGRKKYHGYLAGHLAHEYAFNNPVLVDEMDTLLRGCVNLYEENFGSAIFEDFIKKSTSNPGIDYQIVIGPIWINFMQKYEFNPSHNHSGLFSYVIWVKVPYTEEEERAYWKHIKDPRSGVFCFQHLDCTGTFINDVQETVEGGIVFFPANLTHCVHPFYTSDEFRISISGNVFLEEVK